MILTWQVPTTTITCRNLTSGPFTTIRNTFPAKLTSTLRSLSFHPLYSPVMWRQFVSPSPPFSIWTNTKGIHPLWLVSVLLSAPEMCPICYKEQLSLFMITGMSCNYYIFITKFKILKNHSNITTEQWIDNPIQIHCKFVIDNSNSSPHFKMDWQSNRNPHLINKI